MTSRRTGLLVVLLVLLATSIGAAQEVVPLGEGAAVTVRPHQAGGRPGGHGFVRLEFHDPGGDREHRPVAIRIESKQVRVRKTVDLPKNRRVTVDLPVPNLGRMGMRLLFTFEGRESEADVWLRPGGPNDLGVLLVGGSKSNSEWEYDLRRKAKGLGAEALTHSLDPAGLPDRWTLLGAYDLLVVDAGASGWTPPREQVVARYVAAGGPVVLQNEPAGGSRLAKTFAAGLGRVVAEHAAGVREGRYGLGRWIAYPGPAICEIPSFEKWLNSTLKPAKAGSARPFSTGIPQAMWAALDIPGLGDVPVRAFFVLILVFAVLVGPVSIVFLRRRRRLALLLLTIPAAGFLFAITILLYGFFSEGFGVRGAIRTVTVLDQRGHEAVTAATRTVYAGLQPGALTPQTDTFLSSLNLLHSVDGTPRMLDLDLDAAGRVGGGLIPSRTPTTLTTAQVGRARERLRFRRRQDGAYEVLTGPGFAPVPGRRGAVILREPGGRYLLSQADGILVQMAEGSVRSALQALTRSVCGMPHPDRSSRRSYRDRRRHSYYGRDQDWRDLELRFPLRTWLEERLCGELPRGSYLALVDAAPSLDDLGLEVEWEAGRHLVLGFLADEDLVE